MRVRVKKCQVLEEIKLSDHQYISYEMDLGEVETRPTREGSSGNGIRSECVNCSATARGESWLTAPRWLKGKGLEMAGQKTEAVLIMDRSLCGTAIATRDNARLLK